MINTNVEPPAWLQRIARPLDTELGEIGGMMLGAGLNQLTQKVPETEQKLGQNPVTGQPEMQDVPTGKMRGLTFGEALTETRLNQQSPIWRVGLANQKAQWLSHMANAQFEHAKTQAQISENAAWTKDSPQLVEWTTKSPEWRRAAPTPSVTSTRGMEILKQVNSSDERYWAKENGKAIIQNWNNALAPADERTKSAIAQLPNNGWILDQFGNKVAPSLQATDILDLDRAEKGLPPYGVSKTDAAVLLERQKQQGRTTNIGLRGEEARKTEATRQEGRKEITGMVTDRQMDLQEKRAEDRLEYQSQKIEAQKELLKVAQQYRLDLAKLQASLKVEQGGKRVTMEDFVNRHLTATMKLIDSNWSASYAGTYGSPDAKKIDQLARQALEQTYKSMMKSAQADAEIKKLDAASASPDASTNAPAPAASSASPFGGLWEKYKAQKSQ